MTTPKPISFDTTVGELLQELSVHPHGMRVSIGGCMRFSRVKQRGPDIVDIELREVTSRDPITGAITVQVLD